MSAGVPGAVLGRAGGSLAGAGTTWASSQGAADTGRRGEIKTAKTLDALAHRRGGPTVLHDLRIPGFKANIDHIVVAGNTVYILDSKVWKPAFYWTMPLLGLSFRGLERFDPAEKKTMQMASARIASRLHAAKVRHRIAAPQLIIWRSSGRAELSKWALSVPGARCLSGPEFQTWAAHPSIRKPADPKVVNALRPLLITQAGTQRAA